jgi:hypothetical protein
LLLIEKANFNSKQSHQILHALESATCTIQKRLCLFPQLLINILVDLDRITSSNDTRTGADFLEVAVHQLANLT